jgi:hypothetical protein
MESYAILFLYYWRGYPSSLPEILRFMSLLALRDTKKADVIGLSREAVTSAEVKHSRYDCVLAPGLEPGTFAM